MYCQNCQKFLVRKRFNGRLEDNKVFEKRKYCDRYCMAEAMLKDRPTKSAIGKRLIQHRKDSCEHCGTSETLLVHHIDGNLYHNEPSNWKTLCNSCHTTLHHQQGDILPKQQKTPCYVCGKLSAKRGLCNTHLTRLKRHGSPYLMKKKIGQSWQLVTVDGGPNGLESPE